ncbi:hypothetical protein WICPIJ_000677 [Wickerhamomyces pijperi]|uniref:Transcription initiation protein SPT3 n=1 Tax=Wickerhamomyces pijperi TaxID=599730 RepID=A0A9P8TRQ5_WICPI|nr:hypothetical protein WICPIJ_000677 [Wickerhamomyces pijperi]
MPATSTSQNKSVSPNPTMLKGTTNTATANSNNSSTNATTSATNPSTTTNTTTTTNANDKYKYRQEIQQMMFVSGEPLDPPVETTSLIEDIVRGQVVEILLQSTKTANARGSRSIAAEDVIFLIRKDKAKVNRLRTYLSWKDVRKNAKDQEGGANGVEGAELIEETAAVTNQSKNGPNAGTAVNPDLSSKMKKSKIRLPWELQFLFSEQALDDPAEEDNITDEAEREASLASLKRLKAADDRTKNMTKEEYVHWSECRQASFTFKKARRFRDWAGFNNLNSGDTSGGGGSGSGQGSAKPGDDVIDILGFLTFEIVCSLTEKALIVKKEEEAFNRLQRGSSAANENGNQGTDNNTGDSNGSSATDGSDSRKRKRLFDGPDEESKPLTPGQINEAWRRLQCVKMKSRALRNFGGGRIITKTNII